MLQRQTYLLIRPGFVRNVLFHTKSRTLNQGMKHGTRSNAGQNQLNNGGNKQPQLSGIKLLMAKYGYSAIGIYFGLSVIDFGLSILLVHSMGEEKIGQLESRIKDFFGISGKTDEDGKKSENENYEGKLDIDDDNKLPNTRSTPKDKGTSWGISTTLLTELGIAFAIHKSLIFLRVPLTMAITPSIVKTLQRWGFNIGKASVTTKMGSTLGSKASRNQRFGSWFF